MIFGVPMTFPSISARDESERLSVHFVATPPKWAVFGVVVEIRRVPFSLRHHRNRAPRAIDASYRIAVDTKYNPVEREMRINFVARARDWAIGVLQRALFAQNTR